MGTPKLDSLFSPWEEDAGPGQIPYVGSSPRELSAAASASQPATFAELRELLRSEREARESKSNEIDNSLQLIETRYELIEAAVNDLTAKFNMLDFRVDHESTGVKLTSPPSQAGGSGQECNETCDTLASSSSAQDIALGLKFSHLENTVQTYHAQSLQIQGELFTTLEILGERLEAECLGYEKDGDKGTVCQRLQALQDDVLQVKVEIVENNGIHTEMITQNQKVLAQADRRFGAFDKYCADLQARCGSLEVAVCSMHSDMESMTRSVNQIATGTVDIQQQMAAQQGLTSSRTQGLASTESCQLSAQLSTRYASARQLCTRQLSIGRSQSPSMRQISANQLGVVQVSAPQSESPARRAGVGSVCLPTGVSSVILPASPPAVLLTTDSLRTSVSPSPRVRSVSPILPLCTRFEASDAKRGNDSKLTVAPSPAAGVSRVAPKVVASSPGHGSLVAPKMCLSGSHSMGQTMTAGVVPPFDLDGLRTLDGGSVTTPRKQAPF